MTNPIDRLPLDTTLRVKVGDTVQLHTRRRDYSSKAPRDYPTQPYPLVDNEHHRGHALDMALPREGSALLQVWPPRGLPPVRPRRLAGRPTRPRGLEDIVRILENPESKR